MPVVEHYFSVFKSVQWQICECKLLGIFRLKPQLLPKYMEPAFWSNTLASSMWIVIHLHKSKVAHQIHGGMFSSLADYWSLLLTQRGDTQEVVGIEAKRHQQVGYQNSNGFLHRLSISADFFFWGGVWNLWATKHGDSPLLFGTKSWICWVDSLPVFAGIESVSQRWAESWCFPHQHVGWRWQKMFNLLLL